MTDIKDLSKKLREARAKATSGEWDQLDEPLEVHAKEWVDSAGDPTHICSEFKKQENADFVILAANNITRILDELDRLIEVEKVLRESLPFLSCTRSCSSNLNVYLKCDCSINKIKKALKRADEIGKGTDGKA